MSEKLSTLQQALDVVEALELEEYVKRGSIAALMAELI